MNQINNTPTINNTNHVDTSTIEEIVTDQLDEDTEAWLGGPPHPVNWNLLNADDAEQEWLDLNAWVNWLRRTYALGWQVIPPYWHHHPELVWELSALHLHWLCSYHVEQNGSAPISWHRDFADARNRLRDWVSTSGTRLDRDRPSRQTTWPGEPAPEPVEETIITDRDDDFVEFILRDVARRRDTETAFDQLVAQANGGV